MRNVVDAPPEREAGDWRRSRGGSQEARSCLAASTLPSFMIRLLPPIRLYIPTVGVQQPSEYTGWDTGVADAHCGLGFLTPYVSPSGSLRVDEDGDRQAAAAVIAAPRAMATVNPCTVPVSTLTVAWAAR